MGVMTPGVPHVSGRVQRRVRRYVPGMPQAAGHDDSRPVGRELTGVQLAAGAVRFLAELASLAALVTWGVHGVGGALGWVLAIAAPLLFAAVWGAFLAPRAPRRLHDPARLAAEVVLFGVAAIALFAAELPAAGAVYAVVAILGILLVRWGPGATPEGVA